MRSLRVPPFHLERVPPGEDVSIDQLVSLHRQLQERTDAKKQPTPRNVHPKQHGCVQAEFQVAPNLPAFLRQGLFSEPRTYPALVRFSNAKVPDDRLPDGHGAAIKLFDVSGERLLESEASTETQDFVLVDHPVFFARNAADMIPLLRDFGRLLTGGLLAKLIVAAKAAFSLRKSHRILRKGLRKRPDSPLHIGYWSTTPYRLGETAMKYSLRPNGTLPDALRSEGADKLRGSMSAYLKAHDATFDFLVQCFVNEETTPIEDATIEWPETAAAPVKAATLRIPAQAFDSPAKLEFGEALAFSPWQGLLAHQPLGGINRARRELYERMSARRHELNHTPKREPTLPEMRAVFGPAEKGGDTRGGSGR